MFKGLKYYNVPINKPLWPLFAGSLVTFYAFSSFADFLASTPEYVNDPRNPNAGKKH